MKTDPSCVGWLPVIDQ